MKMVIAKLRKCRFDLLDWVAPTAGTGELGQILAVQVTPNGLKYGVQWRTDFMGWHYEVELIPTKPPQSQFLGKRDA